jgi:chromosome segregation ATPase
MKSNAAAAILIIVCLGLGFVLWEQSQKHAEQTQQQQTRITEYSNHVVDIEGKLDVQRLTNSALTNLLAATREKASNDLAAAQAALDKSQADAQAAEAKAAEDAKAAKAAADAALAEKDKKIASLEIQNTELDKESTELMTAKTNLEAQILATQKKLDASDGDVKFLRNELKELQAKKDQLEKQLSDLAFLKEQVKKLKDELAVDRRLDLIRRGLYDIVAPKGAERLMHPPVSAPPPTASHPLDVELHQNGEATIKSSAPTNAPPVK